MSASPKPEGGGEGESPEQRLLQAIFSPMPQAEDAPRPPRPPNSGGPSGPDAPLHERKKLIFNEQTKMTAGAINTVALAFVTGGPIATLLGAFSVQDWAAAALLTTIWIATGIVLHLFARAYLENLQ